MALSKKIRFEVFKKDDFNCRYCGRCPPNVILEVDHIIPKSKGGKDDIINLITSCFDCNRGKGSKRLDNKILRPDVGKINKELLIQIKEMKDFYKYQRVGANIKSELLEEIIDYWYKNVSSYISDKQKHSFKMFLEDFKVNEIVKAINIAKTRVVGWSNIFRYTCGILHNWKGGQ